jgi:DNA topoisomerase-1
VKWEKINATLPKDVEPEKITAEMALALIVEKASKAGGKKTSGKKATAKKAPAKKAAAKKSATKKARSATTKAQKSSGE